MKKVLSVMMSMVVLVASMTCFGLFNASAASTPNKLVVDGYVDREIVDFSVGFDGNNGVNARVMKIKVKSLNDGNPDYFQWMIERDLAKNGSIVVADTRSGKEDRRIEFSNAYCVHYEETYVATENGAQRYEEIWISAANIKVSDEVSYIANW